METARRSFWAELGGVLSKWHFGLIGLTVIPAATGSAVWAPPATAGFWERAEAAAVGAAIGLLIVVVVAAICVLLRRFTLPRLRGRAERRWGQECMDIAYELLANGDLRTDTKYAEFDKPEAEVLSRYNNHFSARIFRAARELEGFDVISRDDRDGLAQAPVDASSYFARVEKLLDLGNLLGASHRPDLGTLNVVPVPKQDAREQKPLPAPAEEASPSQQGTAHELADFYKEGDKLRLECLPPKGASATQRLMWSLGGGPQQIEREQKAREWDEAVSDYLWERNELKVYGPGWKGAGDPPGPAAFVGQSRVAPKTLEEWYETKLAALASIIDKVS